MQKLCTRAAIVLLVGLAAVGLTACNKYGLTGHLDASTDSRSGTTITGWVNAADPKFSHEDWTMVLFSDGKKVGIAEQKWTERPDVVKAIGPNSWGFSVTSTELPFGEHEICVDAVPKADAATATAKSFLQCSKLFVPEHESKAHIDAVELVDAEVRIAGWVYASPYVPTGPEFPVLIIDEDVYEGSFTLDTRPDVVKAFSTDAANVFGLDELGQIEPGAHEVCLGTIAEGTEDEPSAAVALACVDIEVPAPV
jgi:hypothetical protein